MNNHTHFRQRDPLYLEKVPQTVQKFLPPELAELAEDSLILLEMHKADSATSSLNDYAFILFPIAKAYEGFLKLFFFQIGALQKDVYYARNFRIGRSFNPDLVPRLRDEVWIYDDVSRICGPGIARDLWQLWLDGRNHLFHFYPGDRYVLNRQQAAEILYRLLDGMDHALRVPIQ